MALTRVPVPVTTRSPHGSTNAYLVGDTDPLLVDPAAVTADLTAVLDERPPANIAVTHTHPDHVDGVEPYADRYAATVWALDGFEERFADTVGRPPDRIYSAGERIGPATVLWTPGHASDHVVFDLGSVALVGDLAVADGSVFVGGEDADLRAYLDSLRRLLDRNYSRLEPGHGPPIPDAVETLQWLIDHRLEREERVRAAVESGCETLDGIVDAAYDTELEGVRDLARLAVGAHLEKLQREGTIDSVPGARSR